MSIHDEFVKYPTGKIKKGAFCDSCKRFNSRYVTCDTIAVKGDSVLLVKRAQDPLKGYWALPGGYLDWDETVEECAKRELSEETGYCAKKVTLLGIYSEKRRDNEERQNVTICFFTDEFEKKGEFDSHESTETRWFRFGELPEKMAFDHRKMVVDYLKKTEIIKK